MYYVIAAAALGCFWLSSCLLGTRFGRAIAAVRENEVAAAGSGINPASVKIRALVVSGAMTGLAGALFAPILGYIGPDNFTFETSVLFLTMVVVGGRTLTGALLGAAVITLLPQYLQLVPGYSDYPTLGTVFFGVLIIVLCGYLPDGLGGVLQRLGKLPQRLAGLSARD